MTSRDGKYHVSVLGGAYRTCPTCGKIFFVTDCEAWAYRRWVKDSNNSGRRINFCKWSCMRKCDQDHPLTAHQDPVMCVRPKKYKKQKGDKNGEA